MKYNVPKDTYFPFNFAWGFIQPGFVRQGQGGGGGGGELLNGQNQLSVTKVIESCRRSLKEKISQTLTEIKNKSEFQSATWSKYKHHKHS